VEESERGHASARARVCESESLFGAVLHIGGWRRRGVLHVLQEARGVA
jgi:hypothetical protein